MPPFFFSLLRCFSGLSNTRRHDTFARSTRVHSKAVTHAHSQARSERAEKREVFALLCKRFRHKSRRIRAATSAQVPNRLKKNNSKKTKPNRTKIKCAKIVQRKARKRSAQCFIGGRRQRHGRSNSTTFRFSPSVIASHRFVASRLKIDRGSRVGSSVATWPEKQQGAATGAN